MGVSGLARFSASLARVRFGASAPFGARADNGTAARRAAAPSAASAGAWKPHGRRADAGREETLEPRSGETLSSETARFCFDPLVAGLAMARRYPGGSREDRPRGGAARTVARLRQVWSRGEGEARLDADPSRSASSRATRSRSPPQARPRASRSDGVARRDAPRRESEAGANGARHRPRPRPRVEEPKTGTGTRTTRGTRQDSFSDSFPLLREASARRSSSAATASRSSATRSLVVSRRCVRACFTGPAPVSWSRATAKRRGRRSGATRRGNRAAAIVSSAPRTCVPVRVRAAQLYADSANVSFPDAPPTPPMSLRHLLPARAR